MLIPAPVILSFTALAEKDSGSKIPYQSNLLIWMGSFPLGGCRIGLILKMHAYRALISDIRKHGFT